MKVCRNSFWFFGILFSLLLSACSNPYDTSSEDTPRLTVAIPAMQKASAQRVALAVAPAYIESIAIAVLDTNEAVLGAGIIPVSGGELTFKVPVGVALKVRGAARDKNGENRFEGSTDVAPLRPGGKAAVTLALDPLAPLSVAQDSGFDPNSIFVDENTIQATVIPVNAKSDQTVHYRISGGADQALFKIETLSGKLSFIDPPSFYAPLDSNGDNIYEVQVEVTDEFESATQDLKITVLPKGPPPTSKLGGTVSGLLGSGLVLQNNGSNDLAINSNGPFTFASDIATGSGYLVAVAAAPSSPSQTCKVTDGTGTGTGANVTNVAVTCSTNSYTLGGTIAGLAGSGLVLQDSNGNNLPISGNGAFAFPTPALSGSQYQISVATQPTSKSQTCALNNGSGTVGGDNVTNIAVSCVTNAYKIGGSVTGLSGGSVVLQNNGGDNITVSANGVFTFSTSISSGGAYGVTVFTQPSGPAQTCVVTQGSGLVGGVNVDTVAVNCSVNSYTVGGTISGLSGTGLVLRNNGGDDLTIGANGAFSFNTKVASGKPYAVTVLTNPGNPTQTCNVTTGASGTVVNANITSVAVSCTTNKYTIGGTVSGLVGTGFVLQNNAGDNLSVGADGSFKFATAVDSGKPYSITVFTHPASPSQTCTITGGNGIVASGNVTDVSIKCSTNSYSVSGTINGLEGAGLALNNNSAPIALSGNTFSVILPSGTNYSIAVGTQPSGPAQTCAVVNGAGTVGAADISNVAVNCVTNKYTVSGTVVGLTGSGLALQNNSTAIALTGNAFSLTLASGSSYAITVGAQPTNPPQTCSVSANGTGTVTNANVMGITVTCSVNSYTLGGTVTGLLGSGLQLQTNGQTLAVSADGQFTFAQALASGAGYNVTVSAQPSSPSQTCVVTSGSGTIVDAPVNSVVVSCTTDQFTLGGTVSGLAAGTSVVLRNSLNGDTLTVGANGDFVFGSKVASNAAYNVSVLTQPASPTQDCIVTNGSGTVAGAHVTNISVACSTVSFSVGGTVTGLDGSGLVLNNNGGNALAISANGSFTFTNKIPSGGNYSVTVATHPTNKTQVCNVVGGSGKVGDANVTTVQINCTTSSFTISGSVSGLSGTGLVLQLNGANNLGISTGASTFGFSTLVQSGSSYTVSVLTQPTSPTQNCAVVNGSGTVGGGNVTNVQINCVTANFAVSGTVSGLLGTGFVLRNGTTPVALSGNTFSVSLPSGTSYNFNVGTQPTGPTQTCVVTNPTGTVTSADISNVLVTCATNTYTVSVNVTGMNPLSAGGGVGSSLVLQNNGGNNLTINTNGVVAFSAQVASGAPYNVTVLTQPTNPAQTCNVQAPAGGTISNTAVTVNVTCTTNVYTVSGSVSGLSGTGFVLRDGATQITLDTVNAFSISVPSGVNFNINVGTQPTGPSQTCVVSASGSGTVGNTNVGGISVTCTTDVFSIGGTVTGLQPGTSFTLTKNGTQSFVINTNGIYRFSSDQLSGTTYDVQLTKKALGQTCTVVNGSGTVTTGPVTNVNVDCIVSNIPRFSFVVNAGDRSILTYALSATNGRSQLIHRQPAVPAESIPLSVAVTPDGKHAYVASYVSNPVATVVASYNILADGSLQLITSTSTADVAPLEVIADPSGRFVYVLTNDAKSNGKVLSYAINTKGYLSALGVVATEGLLARRGAIDPDGRFMYVVNQNSDTVTPFRILSTGALSIIAAPLSSGQGPEDIAIDAYGRFAYVSNTTGQSISAYAIGAKGDLNKIICSLYSGAAGLICAADTSNFAAGTKPVALAADPNGKSLYLSSSNTSCGTIEGCTTAGFVLQYSIGKEGEISYASVASGPISAFTFAIDPSGKFAYVADTANSDIRQYTIDASGAFIDNSPSLVRGRSQAFAIAITPGTAPLKAVGNSAYVVNYGSNSISQYSIAGAITNLSTPSVPASPLATLPRSIAIEPTGNVAYVANSLSAGGLGIVTQFRIGADGGLAAEVSNVPMDGLTPERVVADPSGRFAYVLLSSNIVSQYLIGTDGLLSSNSFVANGFEFITSKDLAIDPSGRFAYVVHSYQDGKTSGFITQYSIGSDGKLVKRLDVAGALDTVSTGVDPQSITIDPSGRYVYVANYNGQSVSQFTINASGGLVPLKPSLVEAAGGPLVVAVHPFKNFVYVLAQGVDRILPYSYVESDGLLAPNGGPYGTPPTPGYIAVDAAGAGLYVVEVKGASISQYSIGAKGDLKLNNSAPTQSTPGEIATTARFQ